MTESAKILIPILDKITQNQQTQKKSLVVFDLDSTLFDVSPRSQQILNEFAQHKQFKIQFPQECDLIQKVELSPKDWGYDRAFKEIGLDISINDFTASLHQFWRSCFFSNDYCKYDVPYEGAVQFVSEVAFRGADITYLTGRDVHRMGLGTEEVLKMHNFPLDEKKYKLALKPHKDHNDAHFKKEWFEKIPIDDYQNIWFFENEPVNLHLIDQHFQHIESIFFDSTHCGLKEPLPHLQKIENYIYK